MNKEKNLNDLAVYYKEQLSDGKLQQTYEELVKYVGRLSAHFSKEHPEFKIGNISPGYMDYTYFPFFDAYLRENKLRFGIILNHKDLRFELWLMGQNANVQKHYWDILKTSKWNKGKSEMPKYSVLETILVENPNFDDLEILSKQIEELAISDVEKILISLKEIQ